VLDKYELLISKAIGNWLMLLMADEIPGLARQLAAAIHKRFDTRVFGVYLLGSLAHGGFGRRYSDLDMALIVIGGLKDNELGDIRAAAAELSPVWAARLSVFWSDPNFVVGCFPPLDRIDYLDHAVTLVERQRACVS
jgi:predicted nucleotidyltransferase